ncbi:MAG: hypothetical protein JO270_09925 [Acidobacteriaceae bacterium]|nr:hypothetical protein [Acidobacteriaceae bacterium]MBV8571494.1 hypothetical protein [Acidobacteriaceae bacterium]
MSRKTLVAALTVGCALATNGALFAQNTSPPASADADQQAAIDKQIQLLRQDLRSQRKQLIAANMNLTDAEATKFWPIYDRYVNDLVKTNNAKYELIKTYLQSDSFTDQQADQAVKKWLDIDEAVIQLRQRYLPQFRAALSAKSTARFYQLDRRVQMMIDLQIASAIPLVGP